MNYSQRLDLRQSQNLVMTPQLQQAIKLLQMTNIELSEFVRDEIDNNPLLEIQENHETSSSTVLDVPPSEILQAMDTNDTAYDNSFSDYGSDKKENNFDDYGLSSVSSYKNLNGGDDNNSDDRNNAFVTQKTLRDYLSEQLHMATQDAISGLIGSYLIGMINDSGYLKDTPESIAASLMVPVRYVENVLALCKTFEPIGVFAKDLEECLTLQLKELGRFDPAMQILIENLPLLAKKNYQALMKLCEVDKEDLVDMIAEIKKLNPKPGSGYSSDPLQTLIPDVIIQQKHDGGWRVDLNSETLPKVAVNHRYTMHLGKNGEEIDRYIKENYSRAAWLMKSLDQRAETILKVSSEILRQQDGFFAYGFTHLKPMNLKLVAEELGLHESTISRVTAGKYMRCPRGTFELKFFFMSGITGADGEQSVSSESVKYEIKKLIDAETIKHILSDEDLVELLKQKDINIARRTVAKYREALGILSSVQRRQAKKSLL